MTLLTQNVWRGIIFCLVSICTLTLTSCKEDENGDPDPEPGATVELSSHAQLGDILVDANGMTLYFFTRDADGNSACTGGCLDAWPVFYAEDLDVGQGLNASDFGEIDRGGGEMQTTYKGWPLYYYADDDDPGDATGEGANNNTWFVAKPDYDLMIATQPVEDGGDEVHYLVDAEGNTLYLFGNDFNGVSSCTSDECLEAWPIFDADNPTIPSALSASGFTTIDRGDGEMQLTYKGWPLYYYAVDDSRGDVNGHGVGTWLVMDKDHEAAPPQEDQGAITLEEHETYGQYLVDDNGMTLYFFSNDADGESACAGGCLDLWPVFYRDSPEIGEGLDPDDFGTIEGGGGAMQTTYKGWPLYYYADDDDPGDTEGEAFGDIWFVAKPDYTVMIANQPVEEGGSAVPYLVDAEGNTLYLFEIDSYESSACTESCVDVWPLFDSEDVVAPSLLSGDDFGRISREDGADQLTYKGWPLYYYAGDDARGETSGTSIDNWLVMETGAEAAPGGSIELEEDETHGQYLVDENGMTLYFFSNDADGESACAGGCLDLWPVFYRGNPEIGEGLNADDFGSIAGGGGAMQTTYKGWPLYYYAGDEDAGDINGDAFNDGVWYVAKPDYTVMIANQEVNSGEGPVKYFVDAEGNTLYIFTNDTEDVSNCNAGCIGNWPAFYMEDDLSLPSTVSSGDFNSITRDDDDMQFTYTGMPLYYYAGDTERGDVTGEGAGGVWFVAEP